MCIFTLFLPSPQTKPPFPAPWGRGMQYRNEIGAGGAERFPKSAARPDRSRRHSFPKGEGTTRETGANAGS